MGTTGPPRGSDCRALNAQIRRVGIGASVLLTYPQEWSSVARIASVVERDETPPWFARSLREEEAALLLETIDSERALLVGYGPWHSRSVPILYRDCSEEVPVWALQVVELGFQVDAARSAGDVYEEIGRHDGR